MSRSFCLVTLTYHGDAPAFAQLCKSIDRQMPHVKHYVLVDRSDLALFQPHASANRVIVDCSQLIPQFKEFNAMGRRLWWRWPHRVVRGWIYQQLAKIRIASMLEEDAAIIVDSDAVFVRPIRLEQIFDGDRVKLYHVPGAGQAPEHCKWHDVAMRSFGMAAVGYTGFDYISTGVIWDPGVVRAMIERIESVSGRKWYDVLIANFRFSEYIEYGVFCERVEGPHQQRVSTTQEELCHCSWHYDVHSPDDVRRFVSDIQPHHCAILIQSNLKLEETQRQIILSAFEIAA